VATRNICITHPLNVAGKKNQTETPTETTWAQIVGAKATISETAHKILRTTELSQTSSKLMNIENDEYDTIEHDTVTHQISNEVDKTKIQVPSKTPETAPDSPTPLRWADEPLDTEKTTKTEIEKTTKMKPEDKIQGTTHKHRAEIHTSMEEKIPTE
jgi:hypothetical protein